MRNETTNMTMVGKPRTPNLPEHRFLLPLGKAKAMPSAHNLKLNKCRHDMVPVC